MSYVLSNHGELVVAAHAADERAITRALKQLDDRLILAINLDETEYVWQVVCRYSGDRPAELILSWRDSYGRPIPLSSALIDEVKRLRETDTFAATVAHNRALRETGDRDDVTEATEIAADMIPRIKGRTRAVLHRGVHLRMARARQAEKERRA